MNMPTPQLDKMPKLPRIVLALARCTTEEGITETLKRYNMTQLDYDNAVREHRRKMNEYLCNKRGI